MTIPEIIAALKGLHRIDFDEDLSNECFVYADELDEIIKKIEDEYTLEMADKCDHRPVIPYNGGLLICRRCGQNIAYSPTAIKFIAISKP